MIEFDYSLDYENIDFRKTPELYRIGRGEQGVLLVEPYKSEICQYWRFRTPKIAEESSSKLYAIFLAHLDSGDFVGADMARKFLMMGWTRARRYANHRSGRKYDSNGNVKPQEEDHWTCDKAESARIFKRVYDTARKHPTYKRMYKEWRSFENESHTLDIKV